MIILIICHFVYNSDRTTLWSNYHYNWTDL